jgi:hypothetical protein
MHGIRRAGDGYAVSLEEHERAALRAFCLDLVAELRGQQPPDPGLERLFPRAFPDDDEAADEYDRLVRPSLEEGKLAALRATAATAGAKQLTEEEAQTWLRALNDLRLVLGIRLDVQEGDSIFRMREERYRTYVWLTWLQSELVEALCSTM